MATSIVNCGFTGLQNKRLSCQKFDPFSIITTTVSGNLTAVSKLSFQKHGAANEHFSVANQRYLSSNKWISQHGNKSKMEFIVYAGDQVGDLLPLGLHLPDFWPACIPGVVLAVVVPFFTNKWGPLGKLKEKLDKVEVAVDSVADRVVEMAKKMELFVADVVVDMPKDSALRQILEKVEKVAHALGKNAQMVSDMVDKMDEVEAKVENMVNKANEGKNTRARSDLNAKANSQSTNL